MNYILSDGDMRNALLPFTYTRPVAQIRIGILTIQEKWEKHLAQAVSFKTEGYLSEKFPLKVASGNIIINASFLPGKELVRSIMSLKTDEAVFYKGRLVAYFSASPNSAVDTSAFKKIHFTENVLTVNSPWDIFSKNAEALQADFELITANRKSQPIPATNKVVFPERIFMEQGAKVEFSTLNATKGPIYIGKNAEIMEGCLIRGGLALCDNAILKMGARIYGASTIGPFCKVGGEVSNSVLFANSNKGHEGYLGNSVLGEWCNLGADTNTSNLKNNYAPIRLWSYKTEGFAKTGLQFCGLMMGDHSKCGINTMFNTGTVVGVSANIFGSGFPRNFIPSFSWGGASGFTEYKTDKAFETAAAMMARKGNNFDNKEKSILGTVHKLTQKWRNY